MCLLMGDTENHKSLKEERVMVRGVVGVIAWGNREDHAGGQRDVSEGITGRNDVYRVKKKPHPGKAEQVPGFILLTVE